ncbi:LPXTG cell wall anchor domain-containing protein [Neobacillus soli]|uniref:LPXTG cell wall anchor domain-containing protein n=1 Tax=Neobacillus soli TaxID=220688 RepID=UPI0008256AF8|nr:LPXTG cell wall anchor domain-containing protein [Neobacillus soli]
MNATWFFIIFILGILGFALIIYLRRKKNNNNPHIPTNPNAKPGDSSNYMMGDNRYTGGGQ